MTDNDVKEMLAAADALSKFITPDIDDLTDCLWYSDGSSVYWNTDNDGEDLANIDGNTYGVELYGTPVETENYIIFKECFDGCGGRVTVVFDKSNKFDVDAYWDEVDEEEE
jgi:hypothetical protein